MDNGNEDFYDEIQSGAMSANTIASDECGFSEEAEFFGGIVDVHGNDVEPDPDYLHSVQGRSTADTIQLSDKQIIEKSKAWYPDRKWQHSEAVEDYPPARLHFAKPPTDLSEIKVPDLSFSEAEAIWWWLNQCQFSPRHDRHTENHYRSNIHHYQATYEECAVALEIDTAGGSLSAHCNL